MSRNARRKSPPVEHDIDDIEMADACRWVKCPHCGDLHLVLLDADDEPIAVATLSLEMLEHMTGVIKGEIH
jgi:diadenosine tetraphosphatase ApaH/serine/threonine PP2A family protein phosphatase